MALLLGNALTHFPLACKFLDRSTIVLCFVDGWIWSSGESSRMWEVCGLYRWPGNSNVAEMLQRPLGAEMKFYGKT